MLEMNRNTIISLTKPVLTTLIGAVCIGNCMAELTPIGSEFSIATSLPGDQINSKIALGPNGGYVIWEGNAMDGDGQGISAVRLNEELHPVFEPFVVNMTTDGDQQNPDVALTGDNGAFFIWESDGNIRARLMGEDGAFLADDFDVNSYTDHNQKNPSITVLDNGNAVVVWESEDQDGDRLGVFGQIISTEGAKIGPEFSVPQSSFLNQRSPGITKTADGGFFVVWVSEAPVGGLGSNFSVSVWGRHFYYNGKPKGDEFQLTETTTLAANPSIALNGNGDLALVYSGLQNPAFQEVSLAGEPGNWAIFASIIGSDGSINSSQQISIDAGNDQAVPVIARSGNQLMVAWTGFGGDGNGSDIYGVMLNDDGSVSGSPAFVNQDQSSLQYMPSLAATDSGDFVAVWSSYLGGVQSFDLRALKFDGSQSSSGVQLENPSTPFVYGLGFNKLGITWPAVENADVKHYEVTLDDSSSPIISSSNFIEITDLPAGSRHSASISYVTTAGVKSTLSAPGEGTTWGDDNNNDGLPDSFQQTFWGFNPKQWDDSQMDSDGDGLTNLEELLAGTNPLNPRSVLQVGMEKVDGDYWLAWDTIPGAVYQIQSTGDLLQWGNVTGPKVAGDVGERMSITASEAQNIYRVVRLK
ncbi:MAG: thrombospondin type 3 repeat-containing protein [Verrucomicrobia bacterium]|nr:thrombospondin type 3 repeat-containing protein [Verrucomicrobiota bacterium]